MGKDSNDGSGLAMDNADAERPVLKEVLNTGAKGGKETGRLCPHWACQDQEGANGDENNLRSNRGCQRDLPLV